MHFAFEGTLAPRDGNWFLSTTAQSGAALVAIIGGFVLQKTIALNSNLSALQRRRAVLKTKREMTQVQSEYARDMLLLSNTKRFFHHHLPEYEKMRAGQDIDTKMLWAKYHPWDTEIGDDTRIQESLKKIVLELRNRDFHGAPDGELAQSGSHSSLGPEQAEIELRTFVERRLKTPNLFRKTSNTEEGRVLRARRVAEYNNLKFELALIETDLDGINDDLKDKNEYRHLILGFTILMVFGVSSVLLPLGLLALDSPASFRSRASVFDLFLLGFLALICFVAYLIQVPGKILKNEGG